MDLRSLSEAELLALAEADLLALLEPSFYTPAVGGQNGLPVFAEE